MLIYANGDSFTAGEGLSDSIFFNDYPGDIIDGKFDRTKVNQWTQQRKKIASQNQLVQELIDSNFSKAYPAVLGKKINAEVINGAQGGSSMFGMYYRTVYDILELKKQNKIPNIVIIGLTSEERLTIFNRKSIEHNPRTWAKYITGSAFTRSWNSNTLKKYVTAFWKQNETDDMLVHYLYTCLSIKTFIKSTIDKDVLFLNTSIPFHKNKNIVEQSPLYILKEIWDTLEFDKIYTQISFDTFGVKYPKLCCGHYSELAHHDYAEYIYNNFLKDI